MAYVKGKCVYQGNTGVKLSCHKTVKEAKERVFQLHKTHMPKGQE